VSVRIRQAPGWWPSLVQAVCDTCTWRGPVRNLNVERDRVLVKFDGDHECTGGNQ
jgi:hypothetical protein